jgi:PAS domain S-box-containing protein
MARFQESLEQIHNLLSKKMRDGPGPNSYKRDDGADILDAFYEGNDGSGNLDTEHGGGSLGMMEGFDDDRLFSSGKGHGTGGLSGGFFAMDDVVAEHALSSSFKESMSFGKEDHSLHGMPSFAHGGPPSGTTPTSGPGAAAAHPATAASAVAAEPVAVRTPGKKKGAAGGAAAALADSASQAGAGANVASAVVQKPTSAAAMLGGGHAVPSSAAMAAAMPAASAVTAAGLMDDSTERLSHKEVEQRRREKAKQYFDELRTLLPCGADSKFDKNTILQNTIAMIKQLQAELDHYREQKMGAKRTQIQTSSHDFRSSFDVTRQPLCFCGLDGCVWESNSAFCKLLGYTKSEIHGISLLSSTAQSDSDASSQHWQRLISSGMCNSAFYCHLIRKDQQQLMVNMDLNLIHKRNQPYCFLVATNPTS